MTVAHVASLGGLADTSNVQTYTATGGSNPTGAANTLLVATVLVSNNVGDASAPPTFAGHGVSWSVVQSTASGTSHRLVTYQADGAGATTTKFSAGGYGSIRTGCAIGVDEFSGVDTTTIGVGAANSIVQTATAATGTGTSGASNALAAYSDAANRPYAASAHLANEATAVDASPGTWAELADRFYNSPATSLHAAFNGTDQETTSTPTWTTSSAWISHIYELNGDVGGGGTTVNVIVGGLA